MKQFHPSTPVLSSQRIPVVSSNGNRAPPYNTSMTRILATNFPPHTNSIGAEQSAPTLVPQSALDLEKIRQMARDIVDDAFRETDYGEDVVLSSSDNGWMLQQQQHQQQQQQHQQQQQQQQQQNTQRMEHRHNYDDPPDLKHDVKEFQDLLSEVFTFGSLRQNQNIISES